MPDKTEMFPVIINISHLSLIHVSFLLCHFPLPRPCLLIRGGDEWPQCGWGTDRASGYLTGCSLLQVHAHICAHWHLFTTPCVILPNVFFFVQRRKGVWEWAGECACMVCELLEEKQTEGVGWLHDHPDTKAIKILRYWIMHGVPSYS